MIAERLNELAARASQEAVDLRRAAELTADDPALSLLFTCHAVDRSRHARLLRRAPLSRPAPSRRLERFGLVGFIASLHVAARDGERRLVALERDVPPDLQEAVARVGKETRSHIEQTGRLLDRWRRDGRADEVRGALADAERGAAPVATAAPRGPIQWLRDCLAFSFAAP